jgi:Transposase IS4
MNISATGTVRANRMEKCSLIEVDLLKKDARGTSDHRFDRKSGMLAVRWNDNNVVTVLSNCYGVHPMVQVKRWSAAQKKHVQIPMRNLIAQYNRFMDGTDRMDQNIPKCRTHIRINYNYNPLERQAPDSE